MDKKRKYRKLKISLIVIIASLALFWGYVEVINRHSKQMTTRQKIMKAIYPALMLFTKKKTGMTTATGKPEPPVSFYSLSVPSNAQQAYDFEQLKGKKVLLVNTASDCGYTPQYSELQKLYDQYKDRLVVIGFPANDFKEQEKGNDEQIAEFCKVNYGVSFPLMKKSSVVKGPEQNPAFQWLTDSAKNGWNNKAPEWNFSKYLVDENGVLLAYYAPSVSPLDSELKAALDGK